MLISEFLQLELENFEQALLLSHLITGEGVPFHILEEECARRLQVACSKLEAMPHLPLRELAIESLLRAQADDDL